MGFQARLLKRLPIGVRVYPLDLTFSVLGIPSGITSLIGLAPSRALGVMPPVAEKAWAVILIVGCLAWAVGTLTTKEIGRNVVITRIELMIFGLTLVSIASFVYAFAMIALNGLVGILPGVPLFTFAIGTYIRRIDLLGRITDRESEDNGS